MAKAKDSHIPDFSDMTLGQRLAATREQKGLELEKVAHDTRMRVQRLKELEADDYSRCPHPSYARMFLKDYARYLEIPLGEIKDLLPDAGECGAGGYQYIDELAGETVPVPTVRRLRPRRRLLPALAVGTSVILAAVIALQVVIWVRKFDSLNLGAPEESAAEVKPAEVAPASPRPATVIADDVALLNETITATVTEPPLREPAAPETPASETLSAPLSMTAPPVAPAPPLLTAPVSTDAPAPLAPPAAAATPDERAAFFVGGGLDPEGRLH
jgi:cytoskeleton protein RodZ